MSRVLILLFALAAFAPAPARAQLDAGMEKFFRDGALEDMKILAREKDPEWRIKAAESLAGTKYPDAILALGAALADTDSRVRAAAANSLWRSDKSAESVRTNLLKAIDDTSPDVAIRAAGALQVLGMTDAELAPVRRRVLAAPLSGSTATDYATPYARFLAARGLINLEPAVRLLPPMLAYLDQWSSPRADSRSDDVARRNTELAAQAMAGLAATQDRALVVPLVAELRKVRHGQAVLLKTLALFNPKPDGWVELLLSFLDAPQQNVRVEALSLLSYEKSEKDVLLWVSRVAAMLRDTNASVRSQAMWTLGNARGLAAGHIDAVIAALSDTDVSVRRQAVRAIGEIGDKTQAVSAAAKTNVAERARPALTTAMEKDGDADVRSEAKFVLGKLQGRADVVASPVDSGLEAGGMALLRQRNITFEEGSFFRALADTDLPVIRAFLDAGMSPSNSVAGIGPPIRAALFGGRGCSPAVRPTKAETKAMVRLLLDRGADPNLADANGNTALMEAASKGCDRELMKILLGAGAKMTATNAVGLTAFEMGLFYGHDGLEELIVAGYRLSPEKVKMYEQAYVGKPAAQALIKKAGKR